MKTVVHATLAGAASVATGFAALSVKQIFEAMYEGAVWPVFAEITVRHGSLVFFVAIPAAIACIAALARVRKQRFAGSALCHLLVLIGLALLACGLHQTINHTMFSVGDIRK